MRRAYVIHPPGAGQDLFYTLAVSLGQPWQFQHAYLEGSRGPVELIPDIHRSHGIRSAIVVIDARRGVDRACRLALVHARREGVDCFILVVGRRLLGHAGARAERDARALLDELGVRGAVAPCVVAQLTRAVGTVVGDTRTGMRALFDVLEQLPTDESPAPRTPIPSRFAADVALLDAVAPSIRPATRLEGRWATPDETRVFAAGCAKGSVRGAMPYVEVGEAPPACAVCGKRMDCILQIDPREAKHAWPFPRGLFVVYQCPDAFALEEPRLHRADEDRYRVCYYPDPDDARRSVQAAEDELSPEILTAVSPCLLLPELQTVAAELPELAAELARLEPSSPWEATYTLVEHAMGMRSLRITEHLGGWHETERAFVCPPCSVCGARRVLVADLQWGDFRHQLFTCVDHPSSAHFSFHK